MAGDFAVATAGKIKAFTVTTNSTSLRAMNEADGRVSLVCFMSRMDQTLVFANRTQRKRALN